MTAELHYTEADYVAAQIAWLRQHPFTLVRGFWYPVTIIVVVVIAVANHPQHWRNAAIGGLIAIGLIAFSLLMTRWRWRREFTKIPWMHGPVLASVDAKGIKLKAQGFEVSDDWEAFSKVRETASLFVCFKPGNAFVFIPKREMNNLQISEVRSDISSYARGEVKIARTFA